MISIVVAGRNDDYGENFRERLFRATAHNIARLEAAGIQYEYVLGEWNPLWDRPFLAKEFVKRVPHSRAVVVPASVHKAYSLNPAMDFFEMPAKNAALRRARGDFIVVTNADVLFSDALVQRIASRYLRKDTLYRAHRIDVSPELDWDAMQNPSSQLPSGEGVKDPCWYLGAGGDFCLASRELWQTLRGFDEQIRFSTRANDWHFYLSAGARGIAVEFIGDIFHLDHALGLRNTSADLAKTKDAHFGGVWDIEFALPYFNPDNWGFYDGRDRIDTEDSRISIVASDSYTVAEEQNRLERQYADALSQPSDKTLQQMACMLHALFAAYQHKCRVIFRLDDMHLAIALSGFSPIAAAYGLTLFCNWCWPKLPVHAIPQFRPEPSVLDAKDWICELAGGDCCVREHGSGRPMAIEPVKHPMHQPVYNPLMMRRWLHSILSVQACQGRRIGMYGAGSHTRDILSWGFPDSMELTAILVTSGAENSFRGIPVCSLEDAEALELDAVLVSSATFEPEMLEKAQRLRFSKVLPMYQDWPPKMLAVG